MQLREHYPEFQKRGAVLVAISSEDAQQAASLKEELALPFPLLVDPSRQTIEAYGIFHQQEPKGRMIARPASFIIDQHGRIRYRFVGEVASERAAVQTLLAALPPAP